MQIIIDIPEEMWERIKDGYVPLGISKYLKKGTPLPKEHGRLLILSEDVVKRNQMPLSFSCQKWISEVGLSNATITTIESNTAESEE